MTPDFDGKLSQEVEDIKQSIEEEIFEKELELEKAIIKFNEIEDDTEG